ncbi:MAG TPA: hypothetical protein DDY25_04755 [Peptococcaceae bacterium]|nr:hypothetical protein [Peptococcaceae bacterium]
MKAVAREVELELQHPLSFDEMGDLVEKLLLTLADDFNIKGIVPGHLKALVMEDEGYVAFSCTKPGAVTRQMEQADLESFSRPRLLINAVIVSIPEEDVTAIVEQRLADALGMVPVAYWEAK